jgi:hypothetical protein
MHLSQEQDKHKLGDNLWILTQIKRYTNKARDLFCIDCENVLVSSIMENVSENQLPYAAKSNLDILGTIKSHSDSINDSTIINRIREICEADASGSDIQLMQYQAKTYCGRNRSRRSVSVTCIGYQNSLQR